MVEGRRALREDSENITVYGLFIIKEVEATGKLGQSETGPENKETKREKKRK